MPEDRPAHGHADEALELALRKALGSEGPWDDDREPTTARADGVARTAVVHGVRHRRARRLQAVTGVAALVVVTGLVVSQVVAAKGPSTTRAERARRPVSAAGASAAGASSAQCRPRAAAASACGLLTASPQFSATASGTSRAAAARAYGANGADSHVLHVAVGTPVNVTLPVATVSLWGRPTVSTSSEGAAGAPVVSVSAPPVTSIGDRHGWQRFMIDADRAGTATVEATGTCKAVTSCSGGRTLWVLEVEVGGT